MSVTYINAGSVKNKVTGICDFIINNNVDIMAITETWLYADDNENAIYINEMTPDGYEMKHVARQDESGHAAGGVGLIFRKSVKVVVKDSGNMCRSKTDQFEYMACDVFQNSDARSKIILILVYRPPPSKKNGLKIKSFWKDWNKFIRQFARDHTEIVILGDLNFHLDDLENCNTRKFNSILTEFDLVQHISQPTHTAGHTLDVLITKPDNKIVKQSIAVHDPGISNQAGVVSLCHHFAISFELSFSKPLPSCKQIQYRNIRDINHDAFISDVSKLQLPSQLLQCSCVNQMVAVFNDSLEPLIDKHAPIITRTVVERPNTAWYSSTLLGEKQTRRKLERRWIKSGLEIHRICYRKHCATYNKLLHRNRIQHLQNKIVSCQNNSSKLYKVCKSILCLPKPQVAIEGCNSDKASADALASFFKSKVNTIAKELETDEESSQNNNSTFLTLLQERNLNPALCFAHFTAISNDDTLKLISKSNSKTCSLDVVPTSVIKSFSQYLSPAITIIINKSLESGTVPNSFKKAIVIPCLKQTSLDSSDMASYRPVSNLNYISKLLEKVVYNQLEAHVSVHNLLPSSQSAYRKHFSTETSLLKLSNDILHNLDKKRCTLLVTLDISAAFDTVEHQRLLQRYSEYFGLSETVLQWMESYLSGRFQTVQIGSQLSEVHAVNCGFPQGATLAGLKYNMFTTPLHDLSDLHEVDHEAYADDSNLYVSFDIKNSDETDHAVSKLQGCLSDIECWLLKNRLKLNRKKSKAILFHPPKLSSSLINRVSIKLQGHQLVLQKQITSLGVVLDCNMKMDKQINNVTKSSYFHLRRITKVRNQLNQNIAQTLVNTFVSSRMDYCNGLLCFLPNNSIKKLQRIQNASAKAIMLASRRQHVTPLLKKLHWLPISYRTEFKILLLTYRIMNNLAPRSLSSVICLYKPERSLRSANENFLVRPHIPNNKYGHRAMNNASPFLWNSLPSAIRKARSVKEFKTMLKTHFFIEYYGSHGS